MLQEATNSFRATAVNHHCPNVRYQSFERLRSQCRVREIAEHSIDSKRVIGLVFGHRIAEPIQARVVAEGKGVHNEARGMRGRDYARIAPPLPGAQPRRGFIRCRVCSSSRPFDLADWTSRSCSTRRSRIESWINCPSL